VFVIYRVTLACGVTASAKTMQYYTWRTVSDEAIARVMMNHNRRRFSLGRLRGAPASGRPLFDAVGKAMACPFTGYWDRRSATVLSSVGGPIDMPGADWVLEVQSGGAEGYTFFKTKAARGSTSRTSAKN